MSDWQGGPPPNEVVVEVEDAGHIIRVRAMWGRDGMRPHWESEDGNIHWSPNAFSQWRRVEPSPALGRGRRGGNRKASE